MVSAGRRPAAPSSAQAISAEAERRCGRARKGLSRGRAAAGGARERAEGGGEGEEGEDEEDDEELEVVT